MTDIQHYGIKGQKWGVRRKRDSSTGRVKRSEDSARKKALLSKKVSELTNKELAEVNRRLQLEKQYKDLTVKQKSKARKLVDDVVSDVGGTLAKKYARMAAEALIEQAIKQAKKKKP